MECEVTEVSPEDKKVILRLENIPLEVEVDKSAELITDEAQEESTEDSPPSEDINVDESTEIKTVEADITEDEPRDSENEVEGDDEAEK